MRRTPTIDDTGRLAALFAAMGNAPRLRIMRILLAEHPHGLTVGSIAEEAGIAASTLSHHLDRLKSEGLVTVYREGTYLWHSVSREALQELLAFLYAECCTRNKVVEPGAIGRLGR